MLSVKEAAALSGMSEGWWRARIFRKEVPFHKIGRRVLISEEDVRSMLEQSRVQPEGSKERVA
jgi:excisionase family DNA binding protein